jgi:ferredoxin
VKIKLDRTDCDGFGKCAAHAPAVFSLDEWGYASLERGLSADGELPPELEQQARRALLDCPAHAITERPPSR